MNEIEKLAREYVEDVYNGDTDFIPEAENIIKWLFENHYLIGIKNE